MEAVMRKEKHYQGALFSADVVREALQTAIDLLEGPAPKDLTREGPLREISRGNERWSFDSDEEFFAEYRRGFTSASYQYSLYSRALAKGFDFSFIAMSPSSHVTVQTRERRDIERVFDVFERHLAESQVPVPPPPEQPPPTVFIGHGRNQQWRDLKDHLHDQHGYVVVAYEVGARAGHAIRDILTEMLEGSSFAVLVMTAEDETAEGEFRARQNVVHEIGLFQGRLGFSRAIVLAEEGAELFSNLEGVQQIRFAKRNIRETFGDVLATLRREFGAQ
jgi:predicted nucleotide-binding protein